MQGSIHRSEPDVPSKRNNNGEKRGNDTNWSHVKDTRDVGRTLPLDRRP